MRLEYKKHDQTGRSPGQSTKGWNEERSSNTKNSCTIFFRFSRDIFANSVMEMRRGLLEQITFLQPRVQPADRLQFNPAFDAGLCVGLKFR